MKPVEAPLVPAPDDLSDHQRRTLLICYRTGATVVSTARRVGISEDMVARRFARLAETSRATVKPCGCGLPARHHGACSARNVHQLSARWTRRIRELMLDGQTIRQIADGLGVEYATVVRHAGSVRAERFAQGVACACGRELGHVGACSANWERFFGPRGARPLPKGLVAQVEKPLLSGVDVPQIAAVAGVSQNLVRRALRKLSAVDRQLRAGAIRARREAAAETADASPETIMAAVQGAVSRRLDASVRDEVVADLYLGIVEGRVELVDLHDAARVLVNAAFNSWANPFGPASLDAPIGADSRRTRGDQIADATALGEVDDITIGGPP